MVNAQPPTPVPAIADLHVLINHFPVILTVVGTAFALLALFVGKRGLWLYATGTLALAGLSVLPTYFTGEPAADQLEKSWYVTRRAIHAHEEAGEFALWAVLVMGLIAAYAWWRAWRRETVVVTGAVHTERGDVPAEALVRAHAGLPVWLRALVVVSALVGSAAMYRTSALGGAILHHSTVLQSVPRPASVPAPAPDGGDDDER